MRSLSCRDWRGSVGANKNAAKVATSCNALEVPQHWDVVPECLMARERNRGDVMVIYVVITYFKL